MGKGDKKKRKKKKKKKKGVYSPPEKRNENRIRLEELTKIINGKKIETQESKKQIIEKNFNDIANKEQIFFKKEVEMSYEIIEKGIELDGNRSLNYISFLKWNHGDPKKLEKFKTKIKPFKQYKLSFNGDIRSISNINVKEISGIIKDKKNLKELISELPPYSFILQANIKLVAPYFSKDDDEFYLIQNPCLKEKVFKVPMVRGSGWKGALASAFKDLINREIDKMDIIQSYLRIFGTGSDDFRKLSDMLNDYLKNGKELSFESIVSFVLFELGLKLTGDDIKKLKSEEDLEKWLKEKIWKELKKESNKNLPTFLKTHRGRAVFYPTYFDRLSLEIINPHSRKTRAGINPVHYEVVPKGAEGILQVIYIPFDTVLHSNEEIKQEVNNDIKYLCWVLENLQNIGIGAKGKLGWGRFKLKDKKVFCNVSNIEIPKEWNNG